MVLLVLERRATRVKAFPPIRVVRPVPSCAIWNFLDNELEIDVPLMNVERLCTREVLRGSEADDVGHDQGTRDDFSSEGR